VPEGTVFVVGDNRSPGGSGDSRAFGAVAQSELVGRAFVVIWPQDDWRWL
jgi:signal peptidase I